MTNPLAMSDEDFLNLPVPGPDPVEEGEGLPLESTPDPVEPSLESAPPAGEAEGAEGTVGGEGGNEPTQPEPNTPPVEVAPPADGEGGSEIEVPSAAPTAEDLNKFYAELTAPLKAVNKTFQVSDPAEIRRLMQLGANYGRRMQELAPTRKTVMTLEREGLIQDPDRLNLLLAANRGDRGAIQKLLAEQKIDPLDLDTSNASDYTPVNQQVSDAEVMFTTRLQDVASLEHGAELIQEIDRTWDEASKQELIKYPNALEELREAKASGVLATVTAEVDRRRTLGLIPHDLPFIHAYVQVAAQLSALPGTTQGQPPAAPQVSQPAPVPARTRVAAPNPGLKNGDRAAAAATPRTAPPTAKTKVVSPLAMSDEDFLKTFPNS